MIETVNRRKLTSPHNESQYQQYQQHQQQQQQQHQQQQQQQQQQTKHGAWGHDITTIYNENVCFVFQNINGLTSLTGVHEIGRAHV